MIYRMKEYVLLNKFHKSTQHQGVSSLPTLKSIDDVKTDV